jgi:hypothetical protein
MNKRLLFLIYQETRAVKDFIKYLVLPFCFVHKETESAQKKQLIQEPTPNNIGNKNRKGMVQTRKGKKEEKMTERKRREKRAFMPILLTEQEILESKQVLNMAKLVLSVYQYFAKFHLLQADKQNGPREAQFIHHCGTWDILTTEVYLKNSYCFGSNLHLQKSSMHPRRKGKGPERNSY